MNRQKTFLPTLIICLFLAHFVANASELPIVVLICSYNNEQWVHKNLDSVISQKYHNYKVLYIDDCSSDATAQRVASYIDTHNLHDTITLIRNETRYRKMKNIYNGVHACNDQVIIVQLDGDDWFISDTLFAHINHLYQAKDVWLTYGSDSLGYAQPTAKKTIADQSFRTEKWIYAPTRSFYAWLFKAIKLEDFIAEQVAEYQGLFFPSADDVAFMYPMLEMAGHRCAFIPQVNYKVNTSNPLSNKKIEYDLQEASSYDVRSRPSYKKIETPQYCHQACADVLIISDNAYTLQKSNLLLPSQYIHASTITVIYTADHNEHAALANRFPNYYFIAADAQTLTDTMQECMYHTKEEYVLLMQHNHTLAKTIDVRFSSTLLAKTGAYAFYFGVSPKDFHHPLQLVFDDIYAWKLAWSKHTQQALCDIILLRKKDLSDPNPLDPHALGLCCEQSVLEYPLSDIILNVPCACVPEKPKKKRRLHVPGVDPRTKEKNKKKKSIKEESSHA